MYAHLDISTVSRINTGMPQVRELLTAAEVAGFCAVDLKTIHNWANRGEIRHFRTPGRHLRFRRVDVVEFLRKYGYPVPDGLVVGKPSIYVIDDDARLLTTVKRALVAEFEVTTFQDPWDALVAIGSEPPEGIVLDLKVQGFDGQRCLSRLKQLPMTRHIRTVVFSADAAMKKKALEAGASFVLKPETSTLRAALQGLLTAEKGDA
jgi:excisionase family DNA binding protein